MLLHVFKLPLLNVLHSLFNYEVELRFADWGCIKHCTDIHCTHTLIIQLIPKKWRSYGYGFVGELEIIRVKNYDRVEQVPQKYLDKSTP